MLRTPPNNYAPNNASAPFSSTLSRSTTPCASSHHALSGAGSTPIPIPSTVTPNAAARARSAGARSALDPPSVMSTTSAFRSAPGCCSMALSWALFARPGRRMFGADLAGAAGSATSGLPTLPAAPQAHAVERATARSRARSLQAGTRAITSRGRSAIGAALRRHRLTGRSRHHRRKAKLVDLRLRLTPNPSACESRPAIGGALVAPCRRRRHAPTAARRGVSAQRDQRAYAWMLTVDPRPSGSGAGVSVPPRSTCP